jgi:transcriptional regulator with XRE-family HTH domain
VTTKEGFPDRLRWWRERRGLSQLALAGDAGVSQRHLSFLELGRTAPSREMVLRLATTLALPFREQNALLLAAGFAPIWRERSLELPELAMINRALDFMLQQQEPYPAFVVDRRWNLLRANVAACRFVGYLTDSPPLAVDPAQPVNLADALLAPDALRPLITNWRDVARYFVRGVRADALADGSERTAALLKRLLAYPDVPGPTETWIVERNPDPVLTMDIEKAGTRLRLFTTLATLGTPVEIAAEEIRIECFFPADAPTADRFKAWAR